MGTAAISLCKVGFSVFCHPLALPDISAASFQSQTLRGLVFLVQVPWIVEPDVGFRALTRLGGPPQLWYPSCLWVTALGVWVLTRQCLLLLPVSLWVLFPLYPYWWRICPAGLQVFSVTAVLDVGVVLVCLWEEESYRASYSAFLICSLIYFSYTFEEH